MRAAWMASGMSCCNETATMSGRANARVGKVIRSGMRSSSRSMADTATSEAPSTSSGTNLEESP